jgi:hypothetical protein
MRDRQNRFLVVQIVLSIIGVAIAQCAHEKAAGMCVVLLAPVVAALWRRGVIALAALLIATPVAGEDLADRLERGGVVELDAGTYKLSRPVVLTAPHKVTVRGAGRQRTIIECKASDEPAITIRSDAPRAMYSWSSFEGVSFVGPGSSTCVRVLWATRLQFVDCEWLGWSTAVDGYQVWDSSFDRCSFSRCGSTTSPVVSLQALDQAKVFTNSNNVAFTSCQFEPNAGISLLLGWNTRKCRLVGCKFHGDLPTPAAAHHLVMDNAQGNTITACNFANCGGAAIQINGGQGNVITANQVGKSRFGVQLAGGATKNLIAQNAFAVVDDANGRDIDGPQFGNSVSGNLTK